MAASSTITTKPWTAVHDETPPSKGRLTIHGEVETPTPGYKLHLTKAHPQGINPETLLLTLHRTAPTGIEPQHVVTVPVSFTEDTHTHYRQVQIEPDGITVEIENIL
jgi:hypothetical protein